MCAQACNSNETRVIGSDGHKKHERKDQDSRLLITMYRTGSISGVTCPTIFLVEGKQKRANYTENSLQDNVAAPGSTILMNLTAFMNEEAWNAETTPFVCRIRSSDSIVAENPQWRMKYIVDGFGPHA